MTSDYLAVVVLVCIIDHQGNGAINSLLNDEHRLLKAANTGRDMNFLKGRRLTLLSINDSRNPVAVGDTRFRTLQVDGQTLRVPGCLGARVAQSLVDTVAFDTLDLAPADVHLVCCLVKTDRHFLRGRSSWGSCYEGARFGSQLLVFLRQWEDFDVVF